MRNWFSKKDDTFTVDTTTVDQGPVIGLDKIRDLVHRLKEARLIDEDGRANNASFAVSKRHRELQREWANTAAQFARHGLVSYALEPSGSSEMTAMLKGMEYDDLQQQTIAAFFKQEPAALHMLAAPIEKINLLYLTEDGHRNETALPIPLLCSPSCLWKAHLMLENKRSISFAQAASDLRSSDLSSQERHNYLCDPSLGTPQVRSLVECATTWQRLEFLMPGFEQELKDPAAISRSRTARGRTTDYFTKSRLDPVFAPLVQKIAEFGRNDLLTADLLLSTIDNHHRYIAPRMEPANNSSGQRQVYPRERGHDSYDCPLSDDDVRSVAHAFPLEALAVAVTQAEEQSRGKNHGSYIQCGILKQVLEERQLQGQAQDAADTGTHFRGLVSKSSAARSV